MNIIRKLMGTAGTWPEDVPLGMFMTLFNHESSYPPFLPVVCNIKEYEAYNQVIDGHGSGSINCVNFFPAIKGVNARNRQHLGSEHVVEMDPLHILDDRLVLPIDEFDFKKMPKVSEFVKENGAITFQLDNINSAADLVRDIKNLTADYKYTALLGRETGGSNNKRTETIVTYLSVYDLPYVVPIYNRKKVDGLGFHLTFVWDYTTEHSKNFHHAGEIFLAANQYPENILYVDGQKTFKAGHLGNDYREHFHKLLVKEAKRIEGLKGKDPKAKKDGSRSEVKDIRKLEVFEVPKKAKINISAHGHYFGGTSSSTTTYTSSTS